MQSLFLRKPKLEGEIESEEKRELRKKLTRKYKIDILLYAGCFRKSHYYSPIGEHANCKLTKTIVLKIADAMLHAADARYQVIAEERNWRLVKKVHKRSFRIFSDLEEGKLLEICAEEDRQTIDRESMYNYIIER